MEENLINMIGAAEARASEIRSNGRARAAERLAEGEAAAQKIAAESEAALAKLRREGIAEAERRALEEYETALEVRRKEAHSYADGLLEHADLYVNEIVGRITK